MTEEINININSWHYKVATRFDTGFYSNQTICKYTRRVFSVLSLESLIALASGSMLMVFLLELMSLMQFGQFSNILEYSQEFAIVGVVLLYMIGTGTFMAVLVLGSIFGVLYLHDKLTNDDTDSVVILSYRAWKSKWCPFINFTNGDE